MSVILCKREQVSHPYFLEVLGIHVYNHKFHIILIIQNKIHCTLCLIPTVLQRGMKQVAVVAEKEKLDEGFSLDILNSPSGMKLADI